MSVLAVRVTSFLEADNTFASVHASPLPQSPHGGRHVPPASPIPSRTRRGSQRVGSFSGHRLCKPQTGLRPPLCVKSTRSRHRGGSGVTRQLSFHVTARRVQGLCVAGAACHGRGGIALWPAGPPGPDHWTPRPRQVSGGGPADAGGQAWGPEHTETPAPPPPPPGLGKQASDAEAPGGRCPKGEGTERRRRRGQLQAGGGLGAVTATGCPRFDDTCWSLSSSAGQNPTCRSPPDAHGRLQTPGLHAQPCRCGVQLTLVPVNSELVVGSLLQRGIFWKRGALRGG